MKAFIGGICAAMLAGPCLAQAAVQQYGPATPGHQAYWWGNGFIIDSSQFNAAPVLSGTCMSSGLLGTATPNSYVGFFTTTCTSQTVIVTFAWSATNGWVCNAQDETTSADTLKQTAHTATTATLTGTTAASDHIAVQCQAG